MKKAQHQTSFFQFLIFLDQYIDTVGMNITMLQKQNGESKT